MGTVIDKSAYFEMLQGQQFAKETMQNAMRWRIEDAIRRVTAAAPAARERERLRIEQEERERRERKVVDDFGDRRQVELATAFAYRVAGSDDAPPSRHAYTHAVVADVDLAAKREEVKRWLLLQVGRDWNDYSQVAQRKVGDPMLGTQTAEDLTYEASDIADAQQFMRSHPNRATYIAQHGAEEVERYLADYKPLLVLRWSRSEANARKALPGLAKSITGYRNVRVVPVIRERADTALAKRRKRTVERTPFRSACAVTLEDPLSDVVGRLIVAMNTIRTWTREKRTIYDKLLRRMEKENYHFFQGSSHTYPIDKTGGSILYEVPGNQRGNLARFRNRTIRLLRIGSRGFHTAQFAAKVFK